MKTSMSAWLFVFSLSLLSGCSSNKPSSQFKNGTWNEKRPAEKFTFGEMAKPKPKPQEKDK